MKKQRKTYSGAFKAKVVKEYVEGEKKARELAEVYRIHPNQVRNWKYLLWKKAAVVLEDKRYNRADGHPG